MQFNPLIPPPGIEPFQYLEHVCQIVASSYYCGEGVISLLRQAISALYKEFGVYDGMVEKYPTFNDVLEYIQNIEKRGRSRDWHDSTIRALQAICHGGLSQIVNVQAPTLKMSELLNRNVFLELGDLGESQKKFIIQSLLTYIYYYSMNRGVKEKFLNAIIIEEAHHILRDTGRTVKEPISDIILKEVREFGVGVIIIDQNPSLISVPALANNFCTIGMYTKHGSDIAALSKAMFLNEEQKEYLGKLDCGYGMVKLAGRVFEVFLVKFPDMKRKGFFIPFETVGIKIESRKQQLERIEKELSSIPYDKNSDPIQVLSDWCKRNKKKTKIENKPSCFRGDSGEISSGLTDSGGISSNRTDSESGIKKEGWNGGISKLSFEEEKQRQLRTSLVLDIERYPFDGIASRNKRLKISARKGKNAVEELIEANIVNKIEIAENNGKRVLLEIDRDARKLIIEKSAKHIKPLPERLGGIEHRYWNNRIAEINRKPGYKVVMENKYNDNGYIDQVVYINDTAKIAIEIETGKSSPLETLQKNISLGFNKIICVATNNDAYNSIRQKLIADNLLSNDKIILIMACKYNSDTIERFK